MRHHAWQSEASFWPRQAFSNQSVRRSPTLRRRAEGSRTSTQGPRAVDPRWTNSNRGCDPAAAPHPVQPAAAAPDLRWAERSRDLRGKINRLTLAPRPSVGRTRPTKLDQDGRRCREPAPTLPTISRPSVRAWRNCTVSRKGRTPPRASWTNRSVPRELNTGRNKKSARGQVGSDHLAPRAVRLRVAPPISAFPLFCQDPILGMFNGYLPLPSRPLS
jgi:hypothetical protein